MKMTLTEFIRTGGVPAENTFYLYHPDVFGEMVDCASEKSFLNRRLACGAVSRIKRKLYYERGIGRIPLRLEVFDQQQLFWGCHDGDIMLQSIHSLFDQLDKRSQGKQVVVVGATDDSFTEEFARAIPDCVAKVFALNCTVDHPKAQWYPLGRDDTGVDFFGIPPSPDKQCRVYCNFSPNTHRTRKDILDLIGDKPFVTRVDVTGYGLYTGYPISNEEFLTQLNQHAFCICPRGAGFDTFRLWDSLHLGVVPIVVKESEFHDHLVNLPILFLDSVEEFAKLSQKILEEKYNEMLWTEYDFSVLTADYWADRFSVAAGE